MNRFLFALLVTVLPICAKSQNCFGEFNNTVSVLACVDVQASFEINYQASIIIHPSQDKYSFYQNNTNYPIGSWWITSDKYYNINEYGFKNSSVDIVIVYQVIHQTNKAEIAIMLDGLPFYHGIIDLSFKNGLIGISGSSGFSGQNIPFLITISGDKIFGIAIGKVTIVKNSD